MRQVWPRAKVAASVPLAILGGWSKPPLGVAGMMIKAVAGRDPVGRVKIGLRNRSSVMLDWFWAYLTYRSGT